MHDVLAKFPDAKRDGAGWTAKCPAHDDRRASLSLGTGDDGRTLLHCHAGCSLDAILGVVNLEKRDLFPDTTTAKATISAEYAYRDEGGAHLYDVVRFAPKDFRQRRADGTWKMAGVRRVLYRLRELQGQTIAYIVEGEKDADRLRAIGLPSTTNAGGAGKWRDDYTAQLKAAGVESIVVLPDNDAPGRQHAATVAATCHAAGLKVKIVELPKLPEKGDVSDWIDVGHTRKELVALVKATPLYTPAAAPDLATTPIVELADAAPRPAVTPTLGAILHDVQVFIRRYVVLSDEQSIAVTLWAAHTHVIAAADCTPYLQITSATKRAGKTRLLEVLEPLVARPWLTGRTSAAALIRKIDSQQPTLLLDESDAAFKGEKEYAEALRGILNSGYRRSGRATICVGQGATISVKDFQTFGPKAIAGIGALPDTIADRAMAIALRRRTNDEPCARWRERDGHVEAGPLRDPIVAWAGREPTIAALRAARPSLPGGLGDRQADCWEPLLAIADLAGGEWPNRARRAALALAGSLEDQDITVELLRDLADVVPEFTDLVIPTKDLLAKLIEQDDRPWATWRHDKPITGRGLARLLGPLGIHPDRHLRTVRGYRRDAFDDAIARYLPSQVSMCHATNESGPKPAISMCPETVHGDTSKSEETSITTGVVTHGHIDPAKRAAGDTEAAWLDL